MSLKKLGQCLCELGLLQPAQLDHALHAQAENQPPRLLGMVLLQLKYLTEAQLAKGLASQIGAELCDLEQRPPDPELKSIIPASLAQKCRVIPWYRENGFVRFAAAGPVALAERNKLEFLAERPIRLGVATESAINGQLRELYGLSVENLIADLSESESGDNGDQEIYIHDLREMAQEPTLVNLVNVIITNAINERASDIHIEPFESDIKIKYRIDGVLQEMPPPPKQFQSAIVSRIKIMAGMDIAERYVPQDGQIRVNLPKSKVDIRVSTVPTVYGECVVMRLLNKDESLLELTQLGMDPDTHARFTALLHRPFGINLVCGPTGSGKTTTLYGALNQIFTPTKKIITIEDPVEYQMAGVNQIPVRPKRGLTFAAGLRSILRQDPDIIMVGEIRDRETADISIRAALTGHLVFSTLHTNDAPGAIARLIDMGIEPFLIASSIQGALGQRLVRRLCALCKKPVRPDPSLRQHFGAKMLPQAVFEPAGCDECHDRGYRGRVGIYELLTMTDKLHDLILKTSSSGEIKEAAKSQMRSMREDGWDKIQQGLTTVSEVLQATQFEVGG